MKRLHLLQQSRCILHTERLHLHYDHNCEMTSLGARNLGVSLRYLCKPSHRTLSTQSRRPLGCPSNTQRDHTRARNTRLGHRSGQIRRRTQFPSCRYNRLLSDQNRRWRVEGSRRGSLVRLPVRLPYQECTTPDIQRPHLQYDHNCAMTSLGASNPGASPRHLCKPSHRTLWFRSRRPLRYPSKTPQRDHTRARNTRLWHRSRRIRRRIQYPSCRYNRPLSDQNGRWRVEGSHRRAGLGWLA